MPIFDDLPQQNTAPSGGSIFDDLDAPSAAPSEDEGSGWLGPVAGAAALGAGALLFKNPGVLGKLLKGANTARQQLMLSGLAVPKSILGNIGAATAHSLETKSVNPLKELLFNRQTYDDIASAYKAGGHVGPNIGTTTKYVPTPGRVMGAIDVASQNALQRAGMTADEAATSVFQAPLGKNFGKLGEILDSPEAQYVHPFRRTPFNQFAEGWKAVKESGPAAQLGGRAKNPLAFNTYVGAGAVHGAATSDEQYPASVGLATALSAKYGLPYALAAIAARKLVGGQGGGGIAGSALPVSEYGIEQSADPTTAFTQPGFSRFFK